MGVWKKITKLLREVMRTPGPIRVQLLLLLTLTASSVTSTALQICNRANNTSEENTFTSVVTLEEVREGLRLRVTGRDTMEARTNLRQIEDNLGPPSSRENYSPPMPQQER